MVDEVMDNFDINVMIKAAQAAGIIVRNYFGKALEAYGQIPGF